MQIKRIKKIEKKLKDIVCGDHVYYYNSKKNNKNGFRKVVDIIYRANGVITLIFDGNLMMSSVPEGIFCCAKFYTCNA